jgi:hypothetical protein
VCWKISASVEEGPSGGSCVPTRERGPPSVLAKICHCPKPKNYLFIFMITQSAVSDTMCMCVKLIDSLNLHASYEIFSVACYIKQANHWKIRVKIKIIHEAGRLKEVNFNT